MSKSDIRVRIVGENKTGQAFRKFKQDVDKTQNSLKALRNTIITAFSVREIVQASDAFVSLQNRMGALTGSVEGSAIAMAHMKRIALESRSDFAAVGDLYAKITFASKSMGLSQQEVADATQTVANTFVISGASAIEASNASRQLAQGLASGTLRGDELNSVMEQNSALSELLAKGLGVSTDKLREMGAAGKITADKILPTLIAATDSTSETVADMSLTVGQSVNNLKTQFITLVGNINNATGGMNKIAGAVNFIAQNMDVLLIPAFTGLLFLIPKLIAGFKTLTAVMMANPFVLIATGITAAIMAMYIFRNELVDIFNNLIQKTIPIFAKKFNIFMEKMFLGFQDNFVLPIKKGFTNVINFIIEGLNKGISKVNELIGGLPDVIKDKLGMSQIPTLSLLADPKGSSSEIQKRIESLYADIERISNKVIEKSDLPSITELLFGKDDSTGEDGDGAFSKELSALDKFFGDAKEGYDAFIANIKTVQDEMKSVFQKTYDGLTNATMDFLKTGKANFKEFATSIVSELMRIAIQKLIIDKMFAGFGDIFGGSSKTANPSIPKVTSNRIFDGGGFTGFGARAGGVDGKGGFPAILHPNETVIDHTKGQGMGATVNFNISTVDAAGFDQLLASRKGLITSIINNAMNNQGKMGVV